MTTTPQDKPMQPCPCCAELTMASTGEYEICPVCGWEDDPLQASDPSYAGGANDSSLDQARLDWKTRPNKQD